MCGTSELQDGGHSNKKVDAASNEEQTLRNSRTAWMLGGKTVTSGRDLGVWESSLEDKANFLDHLTLGYLTPIVKLGTSKVLNADDIGVPSQEDLAGAAYDRVRTVWEAQVAKAKAANDKRNEAYEKKVAGLSEEERSKIPPPKLVEPSLAWALARGFGICRFCVGNAFYFLSNILAFVPVLILNDLVKYFEAGGSEGDYVPQAEPWVLASGLLIFPVLTSVFQTRYQAMIAHASVFARAAVSLLLYHKCLSISAAGRASTSTGQVVNMMSNDTTQLQRLLMFSGMTMVAPVQIILALFLIFQQVGNATWMGVAFMIVLAPLNMLAFGFISKLRRKVLKYSDMRVKMMNEILTGIRIIKFYGWERPFGKELGALRGKELDLLTKYSYVIAIAFSIILSSVPFIQPILVFATYTRISNESLTASTAFTTIALFNIMRIPFAFLPMGLLQIIQSKIALSRVGRYLDLPELSPYVHPTPPPPSEDKEERQKQEQVASITIRNGTFSWIDPDAAPIKPLEDKKPISAKKSTDDSEKSNDSSELQKDESERSGQFSNKNLEESVHMLLDAANAEDGKTVQITLQNINLTVESGSLVAVVGRVGSGKSSLLSAILGEMEALNGSQVYVPERDGVNKPGFLSYCTQTPWIVNDTLKNNILFGREFNEDRYRLVLDASALTDDLSVLPAGDMTEIGERGINLSGGQKARVALARSLYNKETQVLLFDDPLSAVDSHVGEHLFSKAICGEISNEKTRILVTNASHVLPKCDYVVVMENGTIKHQGSYQDLIDQGVDFAGAIDVSKANEDADGANETDKEDGKSTEDSDKKGNRKNGSDDTTLEKKGKKLISDEEKLEGHVVGSAYMDYARAGGLCLVVVMFFIGCFGRGSDVGGAFWLSYWSQESFSATEDGESLSNPRFYLGIYCLFAMSGLFGIMWQGIVFAVVRLRASRKLHEDLTSSILSAPVAFFDVTPIGRVLNRFAADMDKVDLELTASLQQAQSMLYSILGAVGAIIAATKGTFLVPMIPMGYLYFLIQGWFRKTSTELQRITSINNSPIFSDFSQTLSGTPSIRAYGAGERFSTHCEHSFNIMNASYFLVQLVNQWLSLRLDVLGGLVSFFIGAFAVGADGSEIAIPAGWVGLALNYSIELTGYLKFGVRMIAQVEADMSSVERILYYSNNIDSEAPAVVPDKDPAPGSWPKRGEIEFKNISMRYRDGPVVLKGLNLDVKGGEKIGVCGRTGSGKSSLMISLFRISEVEPDGGCILIDGVNTGEIGTETLRQNLSIIPQDPVMFSNTIRYNLDPFMKATDEDLWTVLQKVNLLEVVGALPGGLDHEVAEGGENFSLGQRQLICIGRSLLRNPKVLVMDEATASIDNETDMLIQRMIRENFSDATILTIAHRLNTIMDSDRILVLDDGEIAEFDTPENLLQIPDGHFRTLVDKSRSVAEES